MGIQLGCQYWVMYFLLFADAACGWLRERSEAGLRGAKAAARRLPKEPITHRSGDSGGMQRDNRPFPPEPRLLAGRAAASPGGGPLHFVARAPQAAAHSVVAFSAPSEPGGPQPWGGGGPLHFVCMPSAGCKPITARKFLFLSLFIYLWPRSAIAGRLTAFRSLVNFE